mmetsp:Transcript_13928/g.22742  ORF Transcript_13928/g.22742 Transcript_13928/m.22742 type:complete len:84 (-) Transcript_13928:269-520(-)
MSQLKPLDATKSPDRSPLVNNSQVILGLREYVQRHYFVWVVSWVAGGGQEGERFRDLTDLAVFVVSSLVIVCRLPRSHSTCKL